MRGEQHTYKISFYNATTADANVVSCQWCVCGGLVAVSVSNGGAVGTLHNLLCSCNRCVRWVDGWVGSKFEGLLAGNGTVCYLCAGSHAMRVAVTT